MSLCDQRDVSSVLLITVIGPDNRLWIVVGILSMPRRVK